MKIAKTYRIEEHVDLYKDRAVVKEFLQLWRDGFVPKGQCTSPFCESHMKQYICLFKLFYHAKDWDTFYKTACWAREYVNEMIFIYSLSVAVLHRSDTQGMVLPPFYEIFPTLYVNSEVMEKASEYKMKYSGTQKTTEIKTYTIPAQYTGSFLNTSPEQKVLAYFTEDIALNSYYILYHCNYPFWMGGEEFSLNKDRRGELFYWVHQQLLARYYLERLSNCYGSIPVFDWREPIKTGFVPMLRHYNGFELPTRPVNVMLTENPHNQPYTTACEDNMFTVMEIEDYERRIRDAIDLGYIITEDGTKLNIYDVEGFDLLGRIIESNPDSPNTRFYGPLLVLAHQILGYAGQPIDKYKIVPGAMELLSCCLRDPIFYQFYKKIIYYCMKYKKHLPSYKPTELLCPGVKVDGVNVDKLVTYFDHFDFEITNGLYFTQEEWEKDNLHVLARNSRLNHKHFTYKISVTSEKKMDVVVRIYLGPKCDEHENEIPLDENRINFVEMDKFVYTLPTGKTVIERKCEQNDMIKDRTSYRALYHNVMSALKGQEEFRLDMTESCVGFPIRFMLPKGKVEGQEFLWYVYISPYKPLTTKTTYDDIISAGVGSGTRYLDNLPMGYPLDREIEDEAMFLVPNSYMKEVVIYHKTEEDMSTTRM